jgi:hypothetical protein
MTITVASALLETTWLEFGLISTPASTLVDVSTLIDAVAVKLNRDATLTATTTPSDQNVADWIGRGAQELCQVMQFDWRRRYMTTTLTANQFRYSLPNDYAGGKVTIRDMTDDGRRINTVNNDKFDSYFPDLASVSSGNILLATIKNREVWFYPPPGGAYEVEIEYQRSGEGGVTVGIETWMPEPELWKIVDFATSEAFEALHDFEKAMYYKSKWASNVRNARKSEGKRRWSKTNHRARGLWG